MDELNERAQALLKFSLFEELKTSPDALLALAEIMKPQTFNMRDYIIDENENDPRVFFLTSGQVVINKMDAGGQIVVIGKAEAKANPHFGESVLLGKFKKSANVIAYSQCTCLSLSAEDFHGFMSKYPYVVATIYRNIASGLFDRLQKANQDMLIAGLLLQK